MILVILKEQKIDTYERLGTVRSLRQDHPHRCSIYAS